MNGSAQENLLYERELSAYTKYMSLNFGIIFKPLSEFINLNHYYVIWAAREARIGVGSLYGPIFLSNEKDCMIMFTANPH